MGRGASGIKARETATKAKPQLRGGIFENKINDRTRKDIEELARETRESKYDPDYAYESAVISELGKDYTYLSQAPDREDFIKRGDFIVDKWAKRVRSDPNLDSFDDLRNWGGWSGFESALENERQYQTYAKGRKSGKYKDWNDFTSKYKTKYREA